MPRPGEMARDVCPGEDEEETPETKSVASDEDDLDLMHLLDLIARNLGGGDCGQGTTLPQIPTGESYFDTILVMASFMKCSLRSKNMSVMERAISVIIFVCQTFRCHIIRETVYPL